ncbi:MAG: 4-diphosphocytidyl-2-C-methyl-D-erythritol kinase [Rhodospirillaceae bacterium]|nr:4-diphosphocytidyl-2-C-methyl-D-erythritol kinase [Rhodospirillaceae bacterium]
MGATAALRLTARAKINLYLHIVGRRSDGYHLIDSLVCFAEFGDELTLSPSPELFLSLDGPFAPALPHGDNLVLAAALLVDPVQGASIRLLKQLPVAAGIGGGSADAAAALIGLGRLWQRPLPAPDRVLTLGADLPVCLSSGPSFVGGIGEQLAPAPALPRVHLVLANPRRPLPTIDVFRLYGRRSDGRFSAPARWDDAPADAGELAARLAERGNDLTDAAIAIVPEIGDVIAAIAGSAGCLLSRMSGSGATCFGLFAGADEATKAAAMLQAKAPGWWICATAVAAGGAVAE